MIEMKNKHNLNSMLDKEDSFSFTNFKNLVISILTNEAFIRLYQSTKNQPRYYRLRQPTK